MKLLTPLFLSGLVVAAAAQDGQEHPSELAEQIVSSLGPDDVEDGADDRELGGKKSGGYIPAMPVKKTPVTKVTYLPTPKKAAQPIVYASSKKGDYLPRKLQDIDTDETDAIRSDEELDTEESQTADESADDRELGGKKNRGGYIPVKLPPPKKVVVAPKKVATPIYAGKKGYWGGGYYRRLGEEPDTEDELVEELEAEEPEESQTADESADDR
ncbi:hypothetical protein TGARI_320530A, partial [Toxoplasma gondii ARI]